MNVRQITKNQAIVLAGDLVALVGVTLWGFTLHGSLDEAGGRVPLTVGGLLLAWFMAALPLGAYDERRFGRWRELWRPLYAMLLAAPLASWLRSLGLNQPALPMFVLVMAATGAAALLVWRGIYAWSSARKSITHG